MYVCMRTAAPKAHGILFLKECWKIPNCGRLPPIIHKLLSPPPMHLQRRRRATFWWINAPSMPRPKGRTSFCTWRNASSLSKARDLVLYWKKYTFRVKGAQLFYCLRRNVVPATKTRDFLFCTGRNAPPKAHEFLLYRKRRRNAIPAPKTRDPFCTRRNARSSSKACDFFL